MGAELIFTVGLIGLLTGASALAILKARNSQNKNWLDKHEAQRQRRHFSDEG